MKRLFFGSVLLLFSISAIAQTINSFDSNGKRHGIWQKTFEDTKVLRYEGQFAHGKEIGLFKFYKNIDGKPVLTATRQFNDSTNIAEVTFFTSKGKVISKGKMNGRVYIGTWNYYQKDSNALLTLENYDNSGHLEGKRIIYYSNGEVAEETFYKNDKLQGTALNYSLKGVLLKSLVYNEGELYGEAKFYDPKGDILVEGQYKNGKKSGKWLYYENGIIKNTKIF